MPSLTVANVDAEIFVLNATAGSFFMMVEDLSGVLTSLIIWGTYLVPPFAIAAQ